MAAARRSTSGVELGVGDRERGADHDGVGDRRDRSRPGRPTGRGPGLGDDGLRPGRRRSAAARCRGTCRGRGCRRRPGGRRGRRRGAPPSDRRPSPRTRSTRCSRSRISSTAAAPAHIASLPVNVKNMKPLPRSALDDLVGRRDHAHRHVAAAEALAAVDDVGREREVLVAPRRAGAPEPGHHLVGDQQDVVAPADVGDGAPVVVGGDEAAAGGAGDRLEQERRRSCRRPPRSISASSARGVVPRHVREVGEDRLEAGPPVAVAADGEGAEREAVVARVAADDLPALRPPAAPGGRRGRGGSPSRPTRCRRS